MHLIPVIDLMGGQVVHARAGHRNCYQPIESRLAGGADPETILTGILGLYPFDTVYIADLDAITRQTHNLPVLKNICKHFPGITVWLDAGTSTAGFAMQLGEAICPVFGSETGKSMSELQTDMSRFCDPVLSLDHHLGGILGDGNVLSQEDLWPDRIILMNLDRVGTASGPDVTASDLIHRHPHHRFYLAGGIRNRDDLRAAESLGTHGVLLATALHNQTITTSDLQDPG